MTNLDWFVHIMDDRSIVEIAASICAGRSICRADAEYLLERLDEAWGTIERLRSLDHCGCGVCLFRNDMKCLKAASDPAWGKHELSCKNCQFLKASHYVKNNDLGSLLLECALTGEQCYVGDLPSTVMSECPKTLGDDRNKLDGESKEGDKK